VCPTGVHSSPHLSGPLFAQGGASVAAGMLPPILGSPTRQCSPGAGVFDNSVFDTTGSDRCGNLPADWSPSRLHGHPLLPPFVTRAVTLPEITGMVLRN
jgi:hypothetical protein